MKEFLKNIIISILYVESKIVLFFKRPKIIAITGTVGKTTTKDIIYAGLEDSFNVRKSPRGFNSDIGVPLTILGLNTYGTSVYDWIKNIVKGACLVFTKNYPEMIIVEVGANYPGEIRKNAKLLKSDIVVFTRLPEIMAHMEFFQNRQEFIDEKLSLAIYMKKSGTIIYNGDDITLSTEFESEKFDEYNKITFGIDADFAFIKAIPSYNEGKMRGTQIIFKNQTDITLEGVLGEHLGYSVTSLRAVAAALGIEHNSIITKSLEKNFIPAAGRMRVFEGVRGSTIIDDSYNALPESVRNSSEFLRKIDTNGRKIYVLGRLAELGEYTEESYEKAVSYIRESCDIVIFVNDGNEAKKYATNLNFKEIYSFNDKDDDYFANTEEAGNFLESYIEDGDVVVFKGARHSTGFERAIVKLIKKEDKKYLVQEHL